MEVNQENELISIIVPIYNVEKYLGKCVESILNQDYQNIEVILVDDGTKDNSGKIADRKAEKDKRVKVIHQKNSGVSAARNAGIEKAQGKYVCFVDADDYVMSDFISYYYHLIKQNKADIALTPFPRKFNETSIYHQEQSKEDYIEIWNGQRAAKEMLYYNLVIASWNKMISKDLLDKYQIRFNTNLAYGEGFKFSIDCFQRAEKVVVGHRKVYCYRVDNPSSAMTKFNMKLVDGSLESQEEIKNSLVQKTDELLKACKYANWHTHCDCLNTIIGCKVKKKYKEKYKRIKKVCRKEALCIMDAPIPRKEKIKGLLYFLSPYITAKIINSFRLRKFTVEVN